MSGSESVSTFSSLMAIGATAINPLLGMAVGALGGLATSYFSKREQEKEQKKLEKLQKFQQGQLLQKLKADNEQLFSTVKSSVTQTGGAMGAIY